jgi:hypothetical protein
VIAGNLGHGLFA